MPVYFSAGRNDIKRNTLPALRMVQPALLAVKKGHFQHVCNGKRREGIRLVDTEDTSQDHSIEDEYLFVLGNSVLQHTVPVRIHGMDIPVIIVSGASVNVLDSQA